MTLLCLSRYSRGYDQLETSPEAIEQELRPAVCERRQTDLWQIIVKMVRFRDMVNVNTLLGSV